MVTSTNCLFYSCHILCNIVFNFKIAVQIVSSQNNNAYIENIYLFCSFQKIVNNYDENETGYDVIAKALHSMTHMAAHINEMKRKHEHTMRVQEIQSVLHDWDGHDLMTYGDLILEVRLGLFRQWGS